MDSLGSASVNWTDLATMTNSNINWTEMQKFSVGAVQLLNQMNSIYALIGNDITSTSNDNLLGKINNIQTALGSDDFKSVLDLLGTDTDSADSKTIFGDIKNIQSLIGTNTSTDTENTTKMFTQMDKIQDFANKGQANAGAALGVAQVLSEDLGVNGQSPSAYGKLQELQQYINEIQQAALDLGGKQDATGELAQNLVGMVKDLLNEQAKLAGLEDTGLLIENLTKQQAKDSERVGNKLEEIDAKIRALQEAMKVDDVVVKTWFESEE
jgi:hypothetical protein